MEIIRGGNDTRGRTINCTSSINWKELRVIEDETLLKTRVEDTAYLFKSEDEE
ncbi:MAG TPA: hypothetical protein VFD03_05725 [Clostridia bacterium]|nr:hypothetical protein [Clostridia bacterium]